LRRDLALYRVVFGQLRQQDLLAHLASRIDVDEAQSKVAEWRISLEPPTVDVPRLAAMLEESTET
jgi:hypothetical protein